MNAKLLSTGAALGAAALLLSACGGGESEATSESGVPLVQEGKLTVCTHLSYKPFEFEEGGEVVGFDIDIVDAVAASLGVETEIVNTPFETITTGAAFNQGQCDIAAAGMTITPERAEVIGFSDGYFEANQSVVVPEDSTVAAEGDLAGTALGAQQGTTGLLYAQENLSDAEVTTIEDLPLLLQSLQNGTIDAAINDNGVLYDWVEENEGYKIAFDISTGEEYGIGAGLDNTEMIEAVNTVLAEMQEDGSYDESYQKWFPAAPTA